MVESGRFCGQCGTQALGGANFCQSCGADIRDTNEDGPDDPGAVFAESDSKSRRLESSVVEQTPVKAAPRRKRSSSWKWWLLAAIVVAVVVSLIVRETGGNEYQVHTPPTTTVSTHYQEAVINMRFVDFNCQEMGLETYVKQSSPQSAWAGSLREHWESNEYVIHDGAEVMVGVAKYKEEKYRSDFPDDCVFVYSAFNLPKLDLYRIKPVFRMKPYDTGRSWIIVSSSDIYPPGLFGDVVTLANRKKG